MNVLQASTVGGASWTRLTVAAMVVSLVVGCTGAAPGTASPTVPSASATPPASGQASPSAPAMAPGDIEITSFYPEGNVDYEFMNVVNEQFAESYPGSTAEIWWYGDPLGNAQAQRLRAGDPPDVLHGTNSSIPDTAGYQIVKDGLLARLDDALAGPIDGYEGSWKDNLLPSTLPFISFAEDGTIVAVPRELTVIQLFYNAGLFRELGIAPPTTWNELLVAAETLKQNGTTPITLPGTFPNQMQFWYDHLLLRLGGGDAALAASQCDGAFADVPGALEAAQKVAELRDKGYLLDGFEGTDILPSQVVFFSGEAGMILVGSWLVAEMSGNIPDDFEVGAIAFPSLESPIGNDVDLFGSVNTMNVAAEAPRPDLGKEWLRVFSSKSIQNQRVEALGYISGMKGVNAPVGYEGIVDALQTAEDLRVYNFGVYPHSPAELVEAWITPITRLYFGELTPEQMVSEIDTRLAAYCASQP